LTTFFLATVLDGYKSDRFICQYAIPSTLSISTRHTVRIISA
jgi:hypothetical protein